MACEITLTPSKSGVQAQLPRGIDQIRPHLEQVDNVPLLVNLFTDCTAPSESEAFDRTLGELCKTQQHV